MKDTAFWGGIGICQKGCLQMDKQNIRNSSNKLHMEFERIIKDLSADEIEKVMNFVSTLKAQHIQSPCADPHQEGQK